MMRMTLFGLLLMLCAYRCVFAEATTRPLPKLKVLIVDGFSNHDWQRTTALIRGILEPTNLFDLSVCTSPPKADSPRWEQWRPRFSEFDVVIQNCNDIYQTVRWPEEVQREFEQYVRQGGGVLVFHSGNNAFADWPAYNQMIGLGWRKKAFGFALTIDPQQRVVRIPPGEGRDTGHGPRSEVLVHRLGDHPIHAGMPRAWRTPDLEIYYYARGPAENVEVLSYGFDAETQMSWPLEWTVRYGQGRVYTSTFGHVWHGDVQPASMRCAGEQTLLIRALQWLANRPVDFPLPDDFPGPDAVSIRAEIKLAED